MRTQKDNRKEGWLKPNRTENRATTFSNNPTKDRGSLIGLQGKTITTLRPTGEIRVRGRICDAVAEGTFIDSGENVRVTGARDFRLIVERSR